ncbi:unnamed protein product [Cylicocyclus nassatus]|uniref:MTOR-associated protein MEAK7 n=1 Tax=Cylicocyclus nassatus TaxID=53992 RepID=A0AA36GQC0_CYLNA|nr:unnamed protein product [Cylicocyclus nassatus]
MGAEASKATNTRELSHISRDQVERTEKQLANSTKGNSLDRVQFEKVYDKLQPAAAAIFGVIAEKNKCTLSSVLRLADDLFGDASCQSAALLKIFGSIAQALAGVVSIYARRNHLSATDSAAMLDFLMLEAPTDESCFESWLVRNTVAGSLILNVFSPLIFGEGPNLHPINSSPSMLSHSGTVILNMQLPSSRRNEWTLLFSSELHGSSFSQMSKRINEEGPCLVVVKSQEQRIFGCFASAGFHMGPLYHGDATSFLFEIQPHIRIYSATGHTQNYAYLNCQQVSLPNGLGIGGYENIWPFFLHEEYGEGITLANISSFEKCHLSGSDHFVIKDVEVWRVGEKPRAPLQDDEFVRNEKSVIDKDPEAKAILEMTGKTMHSEAYREPAPLLDKDTLVAKPKRQW